MSNFTPGKWKYWKYKKYPCWYIGQELEDTYLAQTYSEANARLIAAAPEMYDELYEALQLCAGHSSYEGDDFDEQAKSIRELLARIDGEQVEA